jgi:hypothetical protein
MRYHVKPLVGEDAHMGDTLEEFDDFFQAIDFAAQKYSALLSGEYSHHVVIYDSYTNVVFDDNDI